MRTLALIVLAACNHPPTLTVAMQEVRQGESIVVPIAPADSDGDSLTVTATAPEGLTVDVSAGKIAIRAGYSLAGVQEVKLHLDDHKGGVSDVTVEVNVAPIGWQWSMSFTASAPVAREHGAFVIADDVAYLIGGSGYAPQGEAATDAYWAFDLNARSWAPLTPAGDVPPPGASRRVAQISEQKLAYLFGGYLSNTVDDGNLYRFDYSLSPPAFKQLTQVNPPPARSLHGFGYDPKSDSFVAFGGVTGAGRIFGDTWTMKLAGDTATWTQQKIAGPTPRYGFFQAFYNGALYVWSGAQGLGPLEPANDTWAFDVANLTWTQVLDGSEAGVPPGRRNGAFIFDPAGPRLVIFGGTGDGATTVPGLSFLDLDKLVWDTVTLDQQPVLRSSSFGVYDPKREQTLLGFGNDRALYRDLSALGY